MRILLLAMGGLVVGWLLIQVLKGRREPINRAGAIGVTVIRLISYMVIGAAVLFIVFLAWQELMRH